MSESSGPHNWNQKIIEEFHANSGKVGGYFEGAHMILIHHVGARSGRERVKPAHLSARWGRTGPRSRRPRAELRATRAWYHNLEQHPRITVEVGTATFPVDATEVTGRKLNNYGAGSSSSDRGSPCTRPRHHASFRCSD